MDQISAKRPKKKCKGYAEASVSCGEGNTEGPCDTCGAQVAFHYTIEIEDIHLAGE